MAAPAQVPRGVRRQRGCGTRLPGTPPGASSGVCRHSRQCSSDCQHGRGGTSQHGTSPRATRWVLSEAWGGRRRWGRAGFRRAEGACATEGRHSGRPGRCHRTPGHCPVCRLPAAGLEAPSGPPRPQTQGWTEGVGEGGVKHAGPRRGLSFPQVRPQLGLSGRSPEPVDSAPGTTPGDKALAGRQRSHQGAHRAARGGHRPSRNGHTWRGVSPQATGPPPSRRRPPPTAHGCSRAARSFPLGWSKT